MPMLHAGALVERAPGPAYTGALAFAELSLRAPFPKPATLRKTGFTLPEGFALSLIAPKSSVRGEKGPMRFDEKLDEGLAWLGAAATAVRARFVVIPTDAELTTGQRDRDLLAAYVEKLRGLAPAARIVWAPSGLWEPYPAAKLAEKLSIVAAFDPMVADVPGGDVVYARLLAIGARMRFGEDALLGVLEKLATSSATDAYVAIESPRSFREAVKLEALAGSAAAVAALEEPGDDDDLDEDEDEDEDDDDDDGAGDDGGDDA